MNVFLLPPLFVLGIALGVLALRSGSLLPGIILHGSCNAALLMGSLWANDPATGIPPQLVTGLCAGVAVGTFSWVCFFAALMSAAGRKGKQRAVALANLAGGLTLLGFGGRAIWQVVRPYL